MESSFQKVRLPFVKVITLELSCIELNQVINWKNNYECEPDGVTERCNTIEELVELAERNPSLDVGKGGAWTVWPGDEYVENQRLSWIKLYNYLIKMLYINGYNY